MFNMLVDVSREHESWFEAETLFRSLKHLRPLEGST